MQQETLQTNNCIICNARIFITSGGCAECKEGCPNFLKPLAYGKGKENIVEQTTSGSGATENVRGSTPQIAVSGSPLNSEIKTSEEIYVEYGDSMISYRDYYDHQEYEKDKTEFEKAFGKKQWKPSESSVFRNDVEKMIDDFICYHFEDERSDHATMCVHKSDVIALKQKLKELR